MTSSRRVFLKQVGIGALSFSFIAALPKYYYISPAGKFTLPRSTPEQEGVSSKGISAFLDEVEKSQIEFHSVMVVRHGKVIAEGWWAPYAASLKHTLYSLSKSFTSTAVGLAIGEGRLNVDAQVLSFFPEEAPKEVNDNLAAMKVKHLLTMSTGHAMDTIQSLRNSNESWVKTFLSQPVEREPGTFFLYNTGATYILSAIVQKVTGQTLVQYLRPRLFGPLGIEDEDWETSPQGINTGGYGLRVNTEDIAKLGLLYLQKGKWRGIQVLSPEWVEEATRIQIASNPSKPTRPKEEDDWAQGYGYQFWRCRPGGYRADGAFGQFSMVVPEYDAVIAITGESFSMQKSMDLVWSYLLPAIDRNYHTLPSDGKSLEDLQQKLKKLNLPPPQKNQASPIVNKISGKEFKLEANDFKAESITLDFSKDACVFTLKDDRGKHQITCGINKWKEQKKQQVTPFPVSGRMEVPTAIAASATWSDDQTLVMIWRLIESAHTNGLTFIFTDNTVTIKFWSSISLGKPSSPEKRQDISGSFGA